MMRPFAALLLGAMTLPAQEADKFSTLDVVALDTRNRAVIGMTASDFAVTSAGATLPISLVIPLGDKPQTFVMVVDDLCLSLDALTAARKQMQDMVAALRPQDRAAILRTSGGTGRDRQPTTDRQHLRAYIADTEYTGGSISRQSCGRAAWIVITQALHGLEQAEGRKSLLLLAGDSPEPAGNAATEIERLAAVSQTTLYTTATANSAIAAATGGTAAATVEQVLEEAHGAYQLTLAGSPGAASVNQRKPGVTVRSRKSTVQRKSATEFAFQPLETGHYVAEVNTPFAGDIEVRVTPIYSHTREKGGAIEVSVHIEARDLGFLRDGSGQYHLEFQTTLGASPEGGRVVNPISSDQVVTLDEEGYRRALENGILLNAVIATGGLGPRELTAAVLDRRSGRSGSASAFLEVPALTGQEFILAGLSAQAGDRIRQSRAVRQFPAGTKIAFSYFVYSPTLDTEGRGSVTTQARLFAGGREVYAGAITPVTFERTTDPQHRQIQGTLNLDPTIAPGHYILHITVMDTLAKQPRALGQFIDFEVR